MPVSTSNLLLETSSDREGRQAAHSLQPVLRGRIWVSLHTNVAALMGCLRWTTSFFFIFLQPAVFSGNWSVRMLLHPASKKNGRNCWWDVLVPFSFVLVQ